MVLGYVSIGSFFLVEKR